MSLPFSLEVHGLLWGLLCLPLALALTAWAYRNSLPPARGAARLGLPLLRALAFSLILLLLLEPVFVRRHVEVLPATLAVLIDDSASLPFLGGRTSHADWARSLEQALEGVEVEYYAFGDTLRALDPATLDSLPCAESNTDLDAALRIIDRLGASRHLSGVLLVSDGNSTQGPQPLHRAETLDARLWTAGTGRREAPRDLQLAELELNHEARIGLSQPVRIGVDAQGLEGQTALVSLRVEGREVARQVLTVGPDGSRQEVNLVWQPTTAGAKAVEAMVSLVAGSGGEATQANNTRTAVVKVRDRGRLVAVLAGAPSPDLGLLRRALEHEPDMELAVHLPDDRTSRPAVLDSLLGRADLLVLVDWPRSGTRPAIRPRLVSAMERVPVFVLDRGNVDATALGGGLPLRLGAAAPANTPAVQAEVLALHPVLGGEDQLDALRQVWRNMPPVIPSRRSIQANPGARVLLATGGQPLLALGDRAGKRSAVLACGEAWRWEIGSQLSLGPNTRARDLLDSLLRWLAAEANTRTFEIAALEDVVSVGEPLRFQATVRGEDGRPRDRAIVELVLDETAGGQRRVVLESRGGGVYTGSSWGSGEGVLRWTATAREGDMPTLADSGLVSVETWTGEMRALKRNQNLLLQLATLGEGRSFDLDNNSERAALARGEGFDNLDRRPRENIRELRLGLREQVALLLLVLALLSAEWFWRKLQGML